MSLVLKRNDGESWLQCALRYAKPYGLEAEVSLHYHDYVIQGAPEDQAAWDACYDWDLLDYRED